MSRAFPVASRPLASLPLAALALLLACGDKHGDSGDTGGHGHHDHSGVTDEMAETEGGTWAVRVTPPSDGVPLSDEFDLVLMVHEAGDSAAMVMDATLAVTATMPAHGHGMNQEPTVQAHGDGTYTASGMLFHMEGQWELAVTVTADGTTEMAHLDLACCD